MTPPIPGWKHTKTKIPVHIPTLANDGVSEIIEVEVDAWKDADGEIYLTGDAEEQLDAVKARHMGLMSPDQIRELRQMLDLTQKQVSHLLQLGEKTWTRWESGRERPSRSMNILLNALMDGRIDSCYLRSRHPDFVRQQEQFKPFRKPTLPRQFPSYQIPPSPSPTENESTCVPA